MKKFFTAFLAMAAFLLLPATAIDVNEKELKSAGDDGTIVFENYAGPHAVIETVAEINSIGLGLGNRLKNNGIEKNGEVGKSEKYSVIHAIDSTSGKLDADIIIINSNATVDHIRNLRRIIASYLSSAYGYNEKDAATVATFVTVYNAVYRNNIDAFKGKYKDIVVNNLDSKKCGLSIKWNEWPGNSQIVIPLGEYIDGGLSSVETSVISDNKVVQSMKEEDDRGIDERKNMVDIKEREADEAAEKAQNAAKDASKERKNLEEQKARQKAAEEEANVKKTEADKTEKDAEDKRSEAAIAKAEAEADPENAEKQKEAMEKQSQADEAEALATEKAEDAKEAEEAALEEKENTEEQRKKAEEAAREAEKQQKLADRKQDEAQSERREISHDQQDLLEEELKNAKDGTVLGLKILDNKDFLSTLVKINAKSGKIVRESPVKVIRGRTVLEVKDAIINIATGASMPSKSSDQAKFYMAVCGEESKKGAIKLCLIDTYTMEIQMESEETLSKDSVLVTNGSNYFVIIDDKGKYFIASYDKQLSLQKKSTLEVNPATAITITSGGLVVTGKDNKSVLLSLSDLSVIEE